MRTQRQSYWITQLGGPAIGSGDGKLSLTGRVVDQDLLQPLVEDVDTPQRVERDSDGFV